MTARRPQPKTPRRPRKPLTRRDEDLVLLKPDLWRVGDTESDHVLGWNEPRCFGPIRTMRWDPHHEPPCEQPGRGVLYASPEPVTALAEKYQKYREVDPHTATPYLYGWRPIRALNLLDLRGDWPINNGASAAMPMGPKNVCRAWAQAILDTWPDLDGLVTRSTMDGRNTFVLFDSAQSSMPDEPIHARALSHPSVYGYVQAWADDINYTVAPSTS